MIKVTIWKKNKNILGYDIVGHADFSEYGSDIVCSAVSALATTCINAFEEILNFKQIEYTLQEGKINFKLNDNFSDEGAQLLLKSLDLGLRSIYQSYEDNIAIFYKEV